jgi:hypothetical protein
MALAVSPAELGLEGPASGVWGFVMDTASDTLMSAAGQYLDVFSPSDDAAIPPPGQVTMRALTFAGPRVVTADEQDLGHSRYPASSIFHAAHAVIAQVRQVTPN